MKTKILFFVFWGVSVFLNVLQAQTVKCYDFDCLMKKAGEYFENGQYQDAVSSITAAKRYPNADVFKADSLVNVIFLEINQLRIQAESARETAIKATIRAEDAAKFAEDARKQAVKARDEAVEERKKVVKARAQVEALIQKGKALENTFPDTIGAYTYLYQTGLQYFQWDRTTQSRDYQNALTYFALARFLQPSDTLDFLITAAQTGIEAEKDFIHGDLDAARLKYALIESNVEKSFQDAMFEKKRQEQIREVDSLFRDFRQQHDPGTTAVDTLEGDWWTLPADFKQYQAISTLVFKNVPITFRKFPTVLGSLPQLKTLAILNCPAARNLNDWDRLPYLQTLILKDNLNLFSLEGLEKAGHVVTLNIENCPALTRIKGCEALDYLTISRSPQVRIAPLLQENKGLKMMELADLPDDSLNTENLTALESLSLSNMKVRNLPGLGKNSCLQSLKIDHLDQLQTFDPPGCLNAAQIANCNKLDSLDNWPYSDSLNKLVLIKNESLKSLPDWTHLPNLQHLLVLKNDNVRFIIGTESIKHAKQIFLVNNRDVVTNSIHAGFGYEWGWLPDPSSVKLEFEHRRTIKWLKNQDFGFKAAVVYAWKKFEDGALYTKKETKGYIGGIVVNYYSPYRLYLGIGAGYGNMQNVFQDQTEKKNITFLWINNLGYQFAPYFLRKDKVSINMDLYTIFEKDDYFILPSFGLTYYHTLGFHRKTSFIRTGDSRRHIYSKRKLERIDQLPVEF